VDDATWMHMGAYGCEWVEPPLSTVSPIVASCLQTLTLPMPSARPQNQGYPICSIIQDGFLYMHNFKLHLWPVCNPETAYLNTDGSPTKTVILDQRRQDLDRRSWELSFGKHPHEELYHRACPRKVIG